MVIIVYIYIYMGIHVRRTLYIIRVCVRARCSGTIRTSVMRSALRLSYLHTPHRRMCDVRAHTAVTSSTPRLHHRSITRALFLVIEAPADPYPITRRINNKSINRSLPNAINITIVTQPPNRDALSHAHRTHTAVRTLYRRCNLRVVE